MIMCVETFKLGPTKRERLFFFRVIKVKSSILW